MNKNLKSFALLLAITPIVFVGCGPSGPSNVAEGVTQEEVQSYDEMLAADEAAMNAAVEADAAEAGE